MPEGGDRGTCAGLGMFASALAGRPLAVAHGRPGAAAWTDGQTVFLDPAEGTRHHLESVAVQASLLAAGSLEPDVVRTLLRRRRMPARYLAVEGHRALVANAALLPTPLGALADHRLAACSACPEMSLAIADGDTQLADAPPSFGAIWPKKILASSRRAISQDHSGASEHVPRQKHNRRPLDEFDDGECDETDDPDLFTSPVGGGGFIGKWLQRLLSPARKTGSGGGPPGADSPTHRIDSARRGANAVSSLASAAAGGGGDPQGRGCVYPEWDVERKVYRSAWCTVREVEPQLKTGSSEALGSASSVRRPLVRLGVGLDRRRRQPQGDDIDVDAAVQARVELRAGSVPDENTYLDSLRRRRDLSVLLLLDISGSTAEPGSAGRTVHQQQRDAAAQMMVALHDLGDRVALYGYFSHGRKDVTMVPVKRFGEHLDAHAARRMNSLEPGAYSRLGAAIRHGSAVLESGGGTPRRLLVVVSDGLAYDHGYERAYGAADARRALTEARRRGTGCVCLTVGAGTDVAELRRVFGSTAHSTIGHPDQLAGVIGPLFRSALRAAEVRRRFA